MGTIERGESNLSFSNLSKVAQGLGITLSQFYLASRSGWKSLRNGSEQPMARTDRVNVLGPLSTPPDRNRRRAGDFGADGRGF
jgi:hypothetical protein